MMEAQLKSSSGEGGATPGCSAAWDPLCMVSEGVGAACSCTLRLGPEPRQTSLWEGDAVRALTHTLQSLNF